MKKKNNSKNKSSPRYKLNLKKVLRARGLTQKDYATLSGMSESKVSFLCKDKSVSVDLRDLYLHCGFLGCSLDELLTIVKS